MNDEQQQLRTITAGQFRELGVQALTYLKRENDCWRLYCADGTAVMRFADVDEAMVTARGGGFQVLSLH